MTNYPGPYEVRINYTTSSGGLVRSHQLRLSMDMSVIADPGDPFSDWTALSRAGATPQLNTWVDGLIALIKIRYSNQGTFNDAELWKYTASSFDASYQSSYPIAVVGTSGAGLNPDSQEIYTFRSVNGGNARLNLMESIAIQGNSLVYAASAASVKAIFDYITALASPVIGRDNGYLFTALNWHPGINEALFKDRYRNL